MDGEGIKPFSGVFTALVTPFLVGGEVDYPSLIRLIDQQKGAKVSGLVVLGTTGETPTLTIAEQERVVATVVEHYQGEGEIIIGTGTNSTASTLESCQRAVSWGVKDFLIATPYYNKPKQDGLFAHYSAVAEQFTDCRIVLYDVPGRTACHFAAETVLALQAKYQNIVAVKDASGDLTKMNIYKKQAKPGFSLLSGDDPLLLPTLEMGGDGIVSVASNLIPAEIVQVYNCFAKGELASASKLFEQKLSLYQALFKESNPIPVKWFMNKNKIIAHNILRLPLTPLSEELVTQYSKEFLGE
ncbi:MAG: 4-hydroxy-tetrahydrodipicolinate synthase [Bdellovibrionales bacterium]|jgi:4-hydroxy-tetrahydrodipicolinate synthase|nr:4-hydroxy-tetrahydrodipicolinate synthase [Bdellovibrionales bacterium]MBT3524948.1 4-hydroxy-tetrahydrodipicolinate synthase [Bdellovibrionales bacterium]MBT7668580.1 4-hydroxy-tetrahydrodipicolinate synthase [Bdellovibrionales bacterium]MBT7766990.1 4-hydroxy-tetrahydrodipicolinate synthase [Bdellovibrionales bacterium]